MEEEDHWPLEDTRFRFRGKKSTCCVTAIVLGVVLGAAIAVIVGLTVAYVLQSEKSLGDSNTCLTPECIELGNQVLSSLDESVDPCDDFYKFACNKYLEQTIVPFGETSTGPLESLVGRNEERFRALIESGNNRSVGALQKAINYYQSCMDRRRVEADSLPALTNLLTQLGGWPLVGVDNSTPWSINDPQGFLTEILYGSDAFFKISTLPYIYNTTRNVLTVGQNGLTVPIKVAYTTPAKRNLIKIAMVTVLKAINSSIDESVYSSAADDILDFETAIANFTTFLSSLNDTYVKKNNVSVLPGYGSSLNDTTLSALMGYMPNFDWTENLRYYAGLGEFSINTSAPVLIVAPVNFLVNLSALIARTDPTTLQNYAKWHLVYKLLPALGREFTDVYYSMYKQFSGSEEPQRYETCVGNIQTQLPLALARAFTEQYFPPEAQSNMSMVLKELKMALKEIISEKDWLDESTKQRALDKAEKINEFLAYPAEIKNNTFLNTYYSGLNISLSESYFVNYIRANKFSFLSRLSLLGHPNNRSTWNLGLPFPPTIVNAAYFPLGNQIYILEGILNFPFFKSYWPDFFKFGTIGMVVGHEFVHGFDITGRQFDGVGNLKNWWSNSSTTQYILHAACFINQYDQYSLPAGKVNGTLTINENIADNGGIATAYRAYKKRMKETGEAGKPLPGLSYTTDQLFFIASAQPWCQIATLQKQQLILQDVHTPSSLRAIGFLSNSEEFSEAFQCPSGSVMNPTHKCKLW